MKHLKHAVAAAVLAIAGPTLLASAPVLAAPTSSSVPSAGVAAAVGGALPGPEIERRSQHRVADGVVVLATDGQARKVSRAEDRPVRVGDAVCRVGDTLEPRRG